MNRKHLWVVLAGVLASPFLSAQQYIRITIPRRAELTPVQRLNREGVDHVVKHKYEKAEALFYKAYLYDPSDPFTLNNLGYVSELQGQVDRAPMRINRINIYAMQLLQQNRAFDAEAVLKQTLSLDPNNPFTLNNLGIAEQATGNLEDALKYYDAAARTHSTQQVVVALDKSSRGKPISTLAAESAEKLRARMADMDIHQIRAHMFTVRGVSALNKEDWATARSNFEQAYAADPSSAFTLNNIGYLAERDGDL
ncbi:MAG: tetratricopeptide repeat protein, partial [Acidobacteria bacterium]|nr:tetratricopeptide repeat protein [Acidobacteriota bacterium]